MVATDYMAVQVIEACRAAKISIPEQIAVIGVDNDELLCNASRPTLTSIKPDHEGLGRFGARILDCMMAGRKVPKSIPTHLKSLGVVERDSTRTVPPAGYIMHEALAYIRSNATKGISASDVFRHVGYSRTLVEQTFKNIMATSVQKQIAETRIEEAKRLLSSSSLPVKEIAARTGFSTLEYLSRAFAAATGRSPSDWREHATA